jgi:pimeloyl-ACP methyl ester carboxylesterase
MIIQNTIPSQAGYLIPSVLYQQGDELVLLCHGITSEKTEGGFYTRLSEQLACLNFSVLSFDFRGHGDSAVPFEDATITGMVEDLIHSYLYARQAGYRVAFVCSSFGASIFLLAQSKFQFRPTRIVFLNPVTDYLMNFVMADTEWGRYFSPQLASADFWLVPTHKIPNNTLSLGRKFISELALLEPQAMSLSPHHRSLVMQGDADTVISQTSVKGFIDKLESNRVTFVLIPGAEHGFKGYEGLVINLTCQFLGDE